MGSSNCFFKVIADFFSSWRQRNPSAGTKYFGNDEVETHLPVGAFVKSSETLSRKNTTLVFFFF